MTEELRKIADELSALADNSPCDDITTLEMRALAERIRTLATPAKPSGCPFCRAAVGEGHTRGCPLGP